MQDLPLAGLLLDELPHQLLALSVVEVDNLNAPLLQVFLSTNEGVILA